MSARYEQVAAYYRRRIKMGKLQPGDPMPTVREICETWHIANATALKTVKMLKDEGLIITGRRRGTHVSDDLPTVKIVIAEGDLADLAVLLNVPLGSPLEIRAHKPGIDISHIAEFVEPDSPDFPQIDDK